MGGKGGVPCGGFVGRGIRRRGFAVQGERTEGGKDEGSLQKVKCLERERGLWSAVGVSACGCARIVLCVEREG